MLSAQEIRDIAGSLKAAQDKVQQVEPPTSTYPGLDSTSAYAISRVIHEARLAEGAVFAGRKIGFTNPDMWPLLGVREPVWGHVYDSTVVQLPEGISQFSLKRFAEPRIEPEVVVHFRTAPPLDGDPEAILGSIDWIAHAFEIVQSHYPGWKFQAPDTIADSALHGALLLGPRRPIEDLGPALMAALESFSLELSCNSRSAGNRQRIECPRQPSGSHRPFDRAALEAARLPAFAGQRIGHHGHHHHSADGPARRNMDNASVGDRTARSVG